MGNQQKSFVIPLAFIGLFFFAIGFAFGINGFLTPVLKGSMEITTVAANLLIAFNFVPFLIFGYPATMCINAIGYKKTMALSFALFAIAFALFIPAASESSLTWFLAACFISGIANTVLQAAVNPYITILGPLESAAQRISIMGICNKLAWPTTTVFMMLVIGETDVTKISLGDLYMPFYIIIGIFVVLGILAMIAPLPEVKAAGEDENDNQAETCSYADSKTSIFQFPHLLLGCLTLFLYVGVETISLSTMTDYMGSLELSDSIKSWSNTLIYIPSIGMCVGYLVGATCIPKFLSQVTAMRICAILAIIGSILVPVTSPEVSVFCMFFLALGCSLMWPALWPMAMADLGKFTKKGSALLTMAMAGGAVMPLARAAVEQSTGSFQFSYWVCLPCFLFILYYGMAGYKIRK